MERFVQLVVASGVALVSGLWAMEIAAMGTGAWLAGSLLVAAGVGGLATGIRSEIEY